MAKILLPILILLRVSQIRNSVISSALIHFHFPFPKLYSTSQLITSVSKPSLPQCSLSDRMRFVFDQIHSIERERSQKDEVLQRIRVWRESQKRDNNSNYVRRLVSESRADEDKGTGKEVLVKKQVELVHGWMEWVEFIKMLIRLKYLGSHWKGENGKVRGTWSHLSEIAEKKIVFTNEYRDILGAVYRFGKDRFDILSSISKQDIRYLVGFGCPSSSKKWVVKSAKLLRKHVHIVEGDVCCSCSLRNSCHKAFLVASECHFAGTYDLLRVLLAFVFEPVNNSVENNPVFKLKSVKTVVRKLLHHVVTLSAVPIDPNLSPPVYELPKKVKRPKPVPRKLPDNEWRKWDWICNVCKFVNFVQNLQCLNCGKKVKPRKELQEMLPRDWICRVCGLLNFKTRRQCHECLHWRPPYDNSDMMAQDKNDFCVDGVDVASFDHAKKQNYSRKIIESTGPTHQRDKMYPDKTREDLPSAHNKPGLGFDDIDDQHGSSLEGNDSTNLPSRMRYKQRHERYDFDDDEPESPLVGNNFTNLPSKTRYKSSHERDDFDDDSSVRTISKSGRDFLRKSNTGMERTRLGDNNNVDEHLNRDLDSDMGDGRDFSNDGFKRSDRGLGSGSYVFNDNIDNGYNENRNHGGKKLDGSMRRNYGGSKECDRGSYIFDDNIDRNKIDGSMQRNYGGFKECDPGLGSGSYIFDDNIGSVCKGDRNNGGRFDGSLQKNYGGLRECDGGSGSGSYIFDDSIHFGYKGDRDFGGRRFDGSMQGNYGGFKESDGDLGSGSCVFDYHSGRRFGGKSDRW